MKHLLCLLLITPWMSVAQLPPILRGNITTNLLSTSAADGWFLVSSNNKPFWSKNGGALTNITGVAVAQGTNIITTTNGSVVTVNGITDTNVIRTLAISYTNNDTLISQNATNEALRQATAITNGAIINLSNYVAAIDSRSGPVIGVLVSGASLFEDFMASPNLSTLGTGPLGIRANSSGNGVIGPIEGETNAPGIYGFAALTTAPAVASFFQTGTQIRGPLGNRGVITNEVRFRVSTNQYYQLLIGLGDDNIAGGTYPTSGIFLQFDTNNANFQYVVSNATGKHTNATTLAPVANTWYKFRSVLTRIVGTTNVVFTIDGAQSITDSTTANIPQVSMQLFSFLKTALNNAAVITAQYDYEFLAYSLEISR